MGWYFHTHHLIGADVALDRPRDRARWWTETTPSPNDVAPDSSASLTSIERSIVALDVAPWTPIERSIVTHDVATIGLGTDTTTQRCPTAER